MIASASPADLLRLDSHRLQCKECKQSFESTPDEESEQTRASRDDPAADGVETATAREELAPSRAELADVITWRCRRLNYPP